MNQFLLQNWQLLINVKSRPVQLFHRLAKLDWYRTLHHAWVDSLNLNFACQVLEAGCASGELCSYLNHCGFQPLGIDIDNRMIEFATKQHQALEFQRADALQTPFDNASFDAVISASLINVLNNPQQLIQELTRLCRPGGLVAVLFPTTEFTTEAVELLTYSIGLQHTDKNMLVAWHRLAPKLSQQTVSQHFETAGLSNIKVSEYLEGMVLGIQGKAPINHGSSNLKWHLGNFNGGAKHEVVRSVRCISNAI